MQEIDTMLKDRSAPEAMSRVIAKIKLCVSPEPADDRPANEMRPSTALPQTPLYPMIDVGMDDPTQLLWNLQQSVPDVGRLFDGSLGNFDWSI